MKNQNKAKQEEIKLEIDPNLHTM